MMRKTRYPLHQLIHLPHPVLRFRPPSPRHRELVAVLIVDQFEAAEQGASIQHTERAAHSGVQNALVRLREVGGIDPVPL